MSYSNKPLLKKAKRFGFIMETIRKDNISSKEDLLDLIFSQEYKSINDVKDNNGDPLFFFTNLKLTKVIIDELGADPTVMNNYGQTAIFYAGNERLNYFLSKGLDINHRDNRGETPFNFIFVKNYSEKTVKKFIKAGAKINEVNNKNENLIIRLIKFKGNDIHKKEPLVKFLMFLASNGVSTHCLTANDEIQLNEKFKNKLIETFIKYEKNSIKKLTESCDANLMNNSMKVKRI